MLHAAVTVLTHINIAYTDVLCMRFLHAVKVNLGVLASKHLYDLCSEEVAVVSGVVAEKQLYFSTFFSNDKDTAIGHKRRC